MAPGRTARAKHQLTYLAFKAREMEDQLQARKMMSNKTKSETQAKYGW